MTTTIDQHADAVKLFFDCGHAELKPLYAIKYRHVSVSGPCRACRGNEHDELFCHTCNRAANTACIEQGHETSMNAEDYDSEQGRIGFQKELAAALVKAGAKETEPPAPRAGEHGDDDGGKRYLKSEIAHLLSENTTLVEQRERLIIAGKNVLDAVFNDGDQPEGWVQIQVRTLDALRELIATIEQEGEASR